MSVNTFDRPHLHIAYILALCLIHFFIFLGARDFWETENHFGEITRVMLLEGDYWITRLNGSLWADSPPFYFWLTVFFSWAVGSVNEWTVRLPSAISSTVLVLVFYLFSRKWFGARSAFVATVVLSTSALTIHVERHIPLNSTFFLWLTISMFFFMDVVIFETAGRMHAYWGWFFLGLACLTKSPISILLPGVVIFLHLLFSRRWEKASALRPVTGLLLLLLVISPWFIYVIFKTSGNWVEHFFAQHHVWRNLRHAQPWYYSVFYFPLGFLPWAFLLPPALISLGSELKRSQDARLRFLCLWWLVVLIFAQLFDGHHNHYLFFALLPASLILGIFFDKLMHGSESERVLAWTKGSLIVTCILFIICGLAAPLIVWDQLLEAKGHVTVFGALVVAGAVWVFAALRRWNYRGVVTRVAILVLVADLQMQGFIFPVLNRLETRPLAEKLRAVAKPGDRVGIFETETLRNHFNFYSGFEYIEPIRLEQDLSEFFSRPGSGFVLVRQRTIERLQKRMNENLTLISVHQPQARGWFASSFPRWAILYSCTAECPPALPTDPFVRPLVRIKD